MTLEGAVRSALHAWTPILATTAPVTLLNCDLQITFDILDTSASKEKRIQYFCRMYLIYLSFLTGI